MASISFANQIEVAKISADGTVSINWSEVEKRAAAFDAGDKSDVNGWCKVILAAKLAS